VADTAGQSGSSSDDMLIELMTQLARRISSTTQASATASDEEVIKSVDTIMKALVAEVSLDKSWIVDLGASKHMTPYPIMFKTYKPMSEKDKVQTAHDSLCLIAGVGDVTCNSEIQLSSVLHVPNFTNNLYQTAN
jgi:hypothetical protein